MSTKKTLGATTNIFRSDPPDLKRIRASACACVGLRFLRVGCEDPFQRFWRGSLAENCSKTVSALVPYCSSPAPVLLFQYCFNTVPVLLQHCSSIVSVLFQCCCCTAPVLLQYYFSAVPILFQYCSSTAPVLLQYCFNTVPVLLQ